MGPTESRSSLAVFPAHSSPEGLLALGLELPASPAAVTGADEAPDTSLVVDPRVAAVFPEFRFRKLVKHGGSGAVYCAEHTVLKRWVAIKVLSPVLTTRVEAVARFEREIRIVGALDHPGIVRAFDAGHRGGMWYLAMEFLSGVDLAALAHRLGPMGAGSACELARQAAVALQYAHDRGLVHRDLKPGNLMLAAAGNGPPGVRILDFGLASLAQSEGVGGELTISGEFLGTVDYVAPEQIEDPRGVDARADIYGLGATLYRLLAGVAPHQKGEASSTLYSKLVRIARDPVPGIATHRRDLPPGLAAVVDRMVAHDPADRFASAAEAAAALSLFTKGADLPRLLRQVEADQAGGPGRRREGMWVAPLPDRRPVRNFGAAMIALGAGLLLTLGLAGLGFSKRLAEKPGTAHGRVVAGPGRETPVGSAAALPAQLTPAWLSRFGLTADSAPRLLAPGWGFGRAFRLGSPRAAHFHPFSDDLYFCSGREAVHSLSSLDPQGGYHLILTNISAYLLALAPDGDTLVWADRRAGVLGWGAIAQRAVLPPIPYAGPLGPADPMGIAFPPRQWRGDRQFGPRAGILVDSGTNGTKGLWRFNLDDATASQLARMVAGREEPVDVRFTEDSILVLNRKAGGEGVARGSEDDYRSRVLRWSGDHLVSCRTDQPIVDPCGIAADLSAGEIYVLCGHHGRTGREGRCVLRLRCAGPADQFTVTRVLDRFYLPSDAGIDISSDGSQMVVTENRADGMVILWGFRRAPLKVQSLGGTAGS